MQSDAPRGGRRARALHSPLGRRLVLLALVLLTLALLLRAVVRVSPRDIEQAVDAAGPLGPVVYCIVLVLGLTVPFNPVSDLVTVSVAALLFEPPAAIAATFVAHALALTVNYVIARRYGDVTLRWLAGARAAALVQRLGERMSYRTVFLVRFMVPLIGIGVDVVSYVAGMRRLGFAGFFAASIVPWTLLSIVFFTTTAFFRERAPLLFLLPAAVLLLGPPLIVGIRRRLGR